MFDCGNIPNKEFREMIKLKNGYHNLECNNKWRLLSEREEEEDNQFLRWLAYQQSIGNRIRDWNIIYNKWDLKILRLVQNAQQYIITECYIYTIIHPDLTNTFGNKYSQIYNQGTNGWIFEINRKSLINDGYMKPSMVRRYNKIRNIQNETIKLINTKVGMLWSLLIREEAKEGNIDIMSSQFKSIGNIIYHYIKEPFKVLITKQELTVAPRTKGLDKEKQVILHKDFGDESSLLYLKGIMDDNPWRKIYPDSHPWKLTHAE